MPNSYSEIIEHIFASRFREGLRDVSFDHEDIPSAAAALHISRPRNLGDVIYTFRFRKALPASIQRTADAGYVWILRLAGNGKYRFGLVKNRPLTPNAALTARKIPDSTPGLIARYALTDEQALLAKVRYNRLIDIFTGITCYSLQSHLRTSVANVGQIETDEVYVGIDKRGVQYVIPVQAKGGTDKLGIVQTEQDLAMCADKFPAAICIPISAQFMRNNVIVLFQLVVDDEGVAIENERHYRLVLNDQISAHELQQYNVGAE